MNPYDFLLILELSFSGLVFVLLFFISAPYGKFGRKGWGPCIPAKYAWFIMEMPAFLVILLYFINSKGWSNLVLIIFILIWQSHYFYRTFVYPFIMGGKEKPYPLLLVLFAILFNTLNGAVNGYYIFEAGKYGMEWISNPLFVLGLLLFVGGYTINKQSDSILKNLRKQSSTYQIPQGGFFRWVSNPHYFGEIMQWLGWAVLTWSWAGFAFACFTFANLVPRAVAAHRWYKDRFMDYPKERKAVIPFIW